MRIPLGTSDSRRSLAQTPDVKLKNRFFESDPTNQKDQVALLTRPGLRKLMELPTAPVRAIYSCPGAFDDALFVVSGDTIYRISRGEAVSIIGTLDSDRGAVSMAATDYPYKLFIADGLELNLYDGATLSSVTVPDGDGIVSVGFIAQFVICVVAQGFDKNGRFYWVEPGESTIDPLNFATAERAPDPTWNVVIKEDAIWFPGAATIELWRVTGDDAAPFIRQQGVLPERGVWEGTVLPLDEYMMVVTADANVWKVGMEAELVSTPGISQRIREAINAQRAG